MFNAKKKRIKQLENTVTVLTDEVKYYKIENKVIQEARAFEVSTAYQAQERAEYKLLLVESLMKQLTININMNGKGKK